MSLSCTCDFDGDGADRYYEPADDFSALDTKRSRTCCSCKTKVKPGDEVLKLRRYRDPSDIHGIEESIYGDEVPLAAWYMCETCGGLYFAVKDLGMCCDLERDLKKQIREYNAMVKHFEAKG